VDRRWTHDGCRPAGEILSSVWTLKTPLYTCLIGQPNSDVKIEQQILRKNCKRQAEDRISTRTIKIIWKELMNSVSCNNFELKDIISVQKAMFDKRRQSYPLFPSSLNYAIRQLQNMKKRHRYIKLKIL